MMVVAVGPGHRIGMVLPELGGLLRHPLMTLEQVRVCKRDGQLINVPELAAEADDHGFPLWQKLTVCTSEAARHEGQPIHRAIVRRLRSAGISGATTYRGSGVSTMSARRTAIACCSWAVTYMSPARGSQVRLLPAPQRCPLGPPPQRRRAAREDHRHPHRVQRHRWRPADPQGAPRIATSPAASAR